MFSLACDVGTASLRVAVFEISIDNDDSNDLDDRKNHRYHFNSKPIASSIESIPIYHKNENNYEQKTDDIWRAFCNACKNCFNQLQQSLGDANRSLLLLSSNSFPIKTIGFTGTCSLVIVDDHNDNNAEDDLERTFMDECDIIMWMDHRANKEAEIIDQTRDSVLEQFGGKCSPEFSLAKLFWMFRNQNERFKSAKAFMELPDWLCYRCSNYFGVPERFPRSHCSLVCKWGYDGEHSLWRANLFDSLGKFFSSFIRISKSLIFATDPS